MAEDKKRDGKIGKKTKKKKEGGASGVFIGIVSSFLIVPSLAYGAYWLHLNLVVLPSLVNTKSELLTVTAENSFSVDKDSLRYWGSYAANLYFGLRTRSPSSPQFGIAWFQQPRNDIYLPKIRHWAEQEDGLVYGWQKHDGSSFGIQHIYDGVAFLNTTFAKRPGGHFGGDWTARVSVKPREGIKEDHIFMSVIAYIALPGLEQTHIHGDLKKDQLNPHGLQLTGLHGFTKELGKFAVRFKSKGSITAKGFAMVHTPGDFSQIKETLLNNTAIHRVESQKMSHYLCLSGGEPGQVMVDRPNFIAVQLTIDGSAELEVVYESNVPDRTDELSGKSYEQLLNGLASKFDARFEETFKLKEKGHYPDPYVEMGQHALSNMVGSMSYFYGQNLVQSKYNSHPVPYGPNELFTAMPCRPFFPRGFLWDEGFHHLLIRHWDSALSEQSLGTWLDLMNVEGWIPRENILGVPAVMKVPSEFIVQRNEFANPPMFFFVLSKFAKTPELMKQHAPFLQRAFPRLKLWYQWINSSQAGPQPGTYRWRGRNATTVSELNPKTLPSGLDDYPRASHPTDMEYHLDLYCWMAISTKFMADLSSQFETSPDKTYLDHAKFLLTPDNLDALHYSDKTKRYCDYGLHTRNVKLERAKLPPDLAARGVEAPLVRVVKSEPKYRLVSDTFGYVSLFPLMLRILQPSSPRLGQLITDIENPDLLWSEYGLRSLAKLAPLYEQRNTEHDAPYWRGSIWLNMNYLVLDALHHYAKTEGPYRKQAFSAYSKLRANIISNVLQQYADTGFLWEHYNDRTGEGEGAHPFTGWTSLIVLIMAEKYD